MKKSALNDTLPPRDVALALLLDTLERGRPISNSLDADTRLTFMSTRDRAFAHLLILTVLRRLGQLDSLIDHQLGDPQLGNSRASPIVRNILRLGVAQLIFLGTPPHAAVNSSVNLAKSQQVQKFKKLINAVLRRISENGILKVKKHDPPKLNTPDWLWRRWCAEFGEDTARNIATAHLREPSLDITVKSSPVAWEKRLKAQILPTGSLRRTVGGNVANLAGYSDGEWWVQDAAAALPAHLLGSINNMTVVDLCAAPGGKTLQLAAMGARVLAVDKSASRLERLQSNLNRLSLKATLIQADAELWRPTTPCDAVLLDAPCTATGTIRRHPDVAHRIAEADIQRMATIQERLLKSAVYMVKPNGILVYSVCSLEREEGTNRIEALLVDNPHLSIAPITNLELPELKEAITSEGYLRTTPALWQSLGGIDGFFIARMLRN